MKRRSLADPNLVEKYIRGQVMPRFMQRLREIDGEVHRHKRNLEQAHTALAQECRGDPEAFERRWVQTAHAWRFDHLNALIRQHNEYYPTERRLPINPRTGDYITVGGRPWRRELMGPGWILERFPVRRTPT